MANPLQEVIDELFSHLDVEQGPVGHHHVTFAKFPSGYGIRSITELYAGNAWTGDATLAYGKVTVNDDWPKGTIYQEDGLIEIKTADPLALRWAIKTLLAADYNQDVHLHGL